MSFLDFDSVIKVSILDLRPQHLKKVTTRPNFGAAAGWDQTFENDLEHTASHNLYLLSSS